jgi:hypothetical protein
MWKLVGNCRETIDIPTAIVIAGEQALVGVAALFVMYITVFSVEPMSNREGVHVVRIHRCE